ncbi:Interferon-induced very large GTPase 1 [Apodemus speciosus]|uniref:Interferon-induced very large GTPase 1 n=1 Tax=Apodemus speciosus TaxID=105296 RepID=A0ABQ0F025_APOSI
MECSWEAFLPNILEDLTEEEMGKFKYQLKNIALAKDYSHIKRGTLQKANTAALLAETLIQHYGEEYSKTVTHDVLIAINQRNLAEMIISKMVKSEASMGKSGKKPIKRKQDHETKPDEAKLSKKIQNLIFSMKPNGSTTHWAKPQTINDTEETNKNQCFDDLIQRLNLECYYAKKMTKVNFLLINKISFLDIQPTAERELPYCFLEKLLALDYNLRFLVYRKTISNLSQAVTIESERNLSRFEGFFMIKEGHSAPIPTYIHPMDIQMAIFHCADDFTRQFILTKLSICQFALPFLVPNPHNSQVEVPLWSLGQIRKSWKEVKKLGWETKIKNYDNQLISSQPTHIVSFIRIGNFVSTSKSQILNLLLSKGKHDHFFHDHFGKNNKNCLLMAGMVEICWFCPGGRAEDRFENCIAFTNLHGNAEIHEKQAKFLHEVSSVTVLLLSASENGSGSAKMNTSILHKFWNPHKPLICLFENVENILDEKYAPNKVRIGIKNLNKVELADKITATLTQLLKESASPCSLNNCANIARKYEFIIDENQRHLQEAGRKADSIVDLLRKVKLSQIKENLLPLQGQLWHDWCKKDQEFYQLREKGNKNIEQYTNEIEKEKQNIRWEQYHKVVHLNGLMESFIQSLQSHPETHTELYFLQRLSLLIEQLTKTDLETLYQRHHFLLTQVQTEKLKQSKTGSIRLWEADLEAISREICDSTLAPEHLLRELGQIYEALEETSSQTNPLYLSVPQIAADLMVSGVPIELMDGDASYVPLKWVAAVFDKVSEKLGDKKIFVLSVLGLQNSGKSTLLHAMFGLQFSLGTRKYNQGAYMQLLKVEEIFREEVGFDFLLVVDSEGLKAPQPMNKAQSKENVLATFIIALGNLTLVNIWGPNLSEIQDVLQIAVHAFLRMKQLNTSPGCLFVHQNTEETIDTNQSLAKRQQLQEKLDGMALAAARCEQCSDVHCFSDVIKFDIRTHIHYFAHLWEGNPPMAPPNPCYSHNVQQLKSRILKFAKEESRGSILKISEFKVLIWDLWKALVKENFIFRFKNTQEVVAVAKLETAYNAWTWELRNYVLDLQNKLIKQIWNEFAQEIPINSVECQVARKYEAIKRELEKYFREDQDRDTLAPWRGKFEDDLKTLKKELVVETIKKCEDVINGKKIQDLIKVQKVKIEHKLQEKIRDLSMSGKNTELHENELRDMFHKIWSENISTVLPPLLPIADDPNVDVDLENILLEHFKQHPHIVSKIRYRGTKKPFSINYSKHVITSQTSQISAPSVEDFEKDIIMNTTAQIMKAVKEAINIREQSSQGYSSSHFHEILQVIDTQAAAATQGLAFVLSNRYKLELALELFQEAANSFKRMCAAFKRANNPVLCLEGQKEEIFNDFKLSCQNCSNIH